MSGKKVPVLWGHALMTPEGKVICVPKWAFPKLRRLGVLEKNTARLSPAIYRLLEPSFDCLTDGLSKLLGRDCSGPDWVVCRCRECYERFGY